MNILMFGNTLSNKILHVFLFYVKKVNRAAIIGFHIFKKDNFAELGSYPNTKYQYQVTQIPKVLIFWKFYFVNFV